MKTDAIFYNPVTKKSHFFNLDKIEEFRKRISNEAEHLIDKNIFKHGDEVKFEGFEHLGGGTKKGAIGKIGWSLGPGGAYLTCGIKVEGEEFGSALPWNYIIPPQSLEKI